MSRRVFEFSDPDRFIIGTVGMPGERTFYLQAREGAQVTSAVLEKSQAVVLAERVDQLLDESSFVLTPHLLEPPQNKFFGFSFLAFILLHS
jgi:uncharacterized repeat protein (TIGR03847 family)